MLKRAAMIGVLFLVGMTALAFVWQPDALKLWLLHMGLTEANTRLPYTVRVDAIHGNLFRTLDLENIRVVSKASRQEVLAIPHLKIRIAWLALSHDEVRISYLLFKLGPGTLEGHGALQLRSPPSGTFSFTTSQFPIHTLANRFVPIPDSVRLDHSGDWTLHFGSGTWRVASVGKLNHAPLRLNTQGDTDHYEGRLALDDLDLARTGFAELGPQRLSGDFHFLGSVAHPDRPTVQGRLNLRAPHAQTPWVLAQIHLREGQGHVSAEANPDGAHATLQATLDIPDRQIHGTWSIDEKSFEGLAVWQPALRQASGVFHAEGTIQASEERWSIRGSGHGQNMAWGSTQAKDIQASFSTSSNSPTQLALAAQFQNDMKIDAAGTLRRRGTDWRCLLSRLTLTLPHQVVAWQLSKPGATVDYGPDMISVTDVELTRGAETLTLYRFRSEGSHYAARIRTSKLDPAVLQTFLPGVITHGGSIQMVMDIDGNAHALTANGHLTADIAGMKIPAAGLDFKSIQADIVCSSGVIQIKNMLGETKKGEVRLSGTARLPALDFTLQSKSLALEIEKDIKAQANVDLRLTGTVSTPHISGEIVLAKGVYDIGKEKKKKKKEKDKTPTPTVQVQPSAPTQKPEIWTRSQVDVTARWDNDVWYRDGLTNIETRGDLRLKKSAMASDLLLTGSLTSVQGTYAYYGKNFAIESGQLQFAGTPEINPLITAEASYESDPTTVYLDITGTLKEPVIKLRSIPPLPEQDIISVLVFGQPLKDLSPASGGRSTNSEMTSMAGTVLGSYLGQSLRDTGVEELNFDVVNVEPTDSGNRLILGRYVTHNLFVSYGQTVSQDGGKGITADYYFGHHWALEGEAGSVGSSHMDFLFRYPLNATASRTLEPLHQSPFRSTLDNPALNPMTPYLPQ